ncbi:hypothetical protein KBC03_06160 [Patescibacteria group bacterium]|nr:hypothetical protein [Patescibacteria group bacterium]
MKIATPFMKLYDQYGKNDRNPEFIAKSKELAARTTVKLPSGEYRLAFKDQF